MPEGQLALPAIPGLALIVGPVFLCFGHAYKITNTVTSAAYIGITRKAVEKRFGGHCRASKREDKVLYRAMRKYGLDKFTVQHFASAFSKNSLNELERLLIVQERTHVRDGGYNMTGGGEGTPDICEETRIKMCAAAAARANNPTTMAKLSAARLGRKKSPEAIAKRVAWQTGRPLSDAHKAALSKKMKGRVLSKEHRSKISKTLTGRSRTPEQIEASRQGMIGKRHSPEWYAAISAARSTPESRAKTAAANRHSWSTSSTRRKSQSEKMSKYMKAYWEKKKNVGSI